MGLRKVVRMIDEAKPFWSWALAMHISLGVFSFSTGLCAIWLAVTKASAGTTPFFQFDNIAGSLLGTLLISGVLTMVQLVSLARFNSIVGEAARKTREVEVFMNYHQGKLTIKVFRIELSWNKFTAMTISAVISAGLSILKVLAHQV